MEMPRRLVMCLFLVVCPLSLAASDSAVAMLYAKGGTSYLNGNSVPKSSAVFAGDLVQTPADSVASVNMLGSSVTVLSNSLVQVKDNQIKLEHGSIRIGSSKAMVAEVGDIKITPASNVWTDFQVSDTDGTVQIIARKGDLRLSDGTILAQGDQTTRDETDKKRKKKRGAGPVPGANGGVLNSPAVIVGGTAAVGGVTTWVLLQGDNPLSPSAP